MMRRRPETSEAEELMFSFLLLLLLVSTFSPLMNESRKRRQFVDVGSKKEENAKAYYPFFF